MGRSIIERFENMYMPEPNSGCWIWLGYIWQDTGYACFAITHSQTKQAHIVAYRLYRGEIPEGMQLDHLCRTRWCSNPWHLEPVPCKENLLRGNTRNARNAAVTHCPAGHPYEGTNLYIRKSNGQRGCRACRNDVRRRAAAKHKEVYNARRREKKRVANASLN